MKEIIVTEEDAKAIVELTSIAYSEGLLGDDIFPLLRLINDIYPEILNKCSWIKELL